MTDHATDVFTRWIVGIAGGVVILVGAGLLSNLIELRQDIAIVKTNTDQISRTISDHESRIRTIENGRRNNKSSDTTGTKD